MEFEMEAPDSFEQEGEGLKQAGKYHSVVLGVEENPTTKDGKLIDNAVFRARCLVLDGTTQGQSRKEFELMFFSPKMSDKDGGKMAVKKIWFFTQAIGCSSIVDGKMKVDFGEDGAGAVGKQFVIDIEMRKSTKNGNEYINPSMVYCNAWHVDNPAVKDVPKDKAALALLPASMRKKPEDFAKKDGAKTATSGQTAKPTQAPQQTPPAVDVGDL